MVLCFLAGIIIVYILYKVLDTLYRKPVIGCDGKYVLITGCDTGFGNALARRLDGKGCHVIATCLTEKGEESLKKECSSRLRTVYLDVSDETSVSKVFEQVKEILPSGAGLWGVVNNAGVPGRSIGPPEWITIEDYKYINEINLLGLINVTMTFLPLIKKAKGRVVNMASILGRTSLGLSLPYCCSKYGVEAFSDGLRRQLIQYGCSVHILEPGYHTTNIINRADNEKIVRATWEQASPETKQEYGEEYLEKVIVGALDKMIPSIASSKIDDVIDAYEHALFALRPRARYVVGSDAKFMWLPIQWLPEWLGDWVGEILAHYMPKPAACRNIA